MPIYIFYIIATRNTKRAKIKENQFIGVSTLFSADTFYFFCEEPKIGRCTQKRYLHAALCSERMTNNLKVKFSVFS
jgi:hypothetical protein